MGQMRLCNERAEGIPAQWKAFLKLFACFAVFTNFSGTFLNTYLLRATGSSESVMAFNIVLAAVQPFAMLMAVWLMHARSPLFSQRVGLICYAGVFLVLMLMGESAAPYILYLAALFSAANGFFYTTYAMQLLTYSDDGNRDACYGVQTALNGVIGIVLPTLTGWLLASFSDFTGYRILFAVGFLVAMLSVYLSTRLQPIQNTQPKARLGWAFRVLITVKPARMAMLASTAGGFHDGTMVFFLNLLIYDIVKNEFVIGVAGTTAGALAILASLVYARVVGPGNRTRAIAVSLSITIASAVALIFKVSLETLLLFHLLRSTLCCFFMTPPLTAYFGVVERLPQLKGLGGEVHALREFWYSAGRILGVLLTLALSNMKNGVGVVILIILLIQIIPALLMKQMRVSESDSRAV